MTRHRKDVEDPHALGPRALRPDRAGYSVANSPPLPTPAPEATDPHWMILSPVNQYGGLQFAQKNVSANSVEVSPTGPPVTWQLRMARPGGGNLAEDPVTERMEVEDVMLVLGYEWRLIHPSRLDGFVGVRVRIAIPS